jgi:hypothetical protein
VCTPFLDRSIGPGGHWTDEFRRPQTRLVSTVQTKMARLGLVLVGALMCVSCATVTPRTSDRLRKDCQQDVGSDARCVALLTDPQDGYEAKAEVQAAEQVREAGVFNDRLARLRAAHEARIRAKVATSSQSASRLSGLVPPMVEPEPEPEPDELELELALLAQEDQLDTGSSLRAIKLAVPPPLRPPVVVLPKLPTRAPVPSFGPTPEHWLVAATCLLDSDQAALTAVMAGARGKASRRSLGGLALIVLDVQGMKTRIAAERGHRGLAKTSPLCSSSNLELASNHLRAQLGPVATKASQAEQYGRGLRQLTDVLETRAGLPRAQ